MKTGEAFPPRHSLLQNCGFHYLKLEIHGACMKAGFLICLTLLLKEIFAIYFFYSFLIATSFFVLHQNAKMFLF